MKREVTVRRGKCVECLKTFTILPAGVLPFKRYHESIVEQAVSDFEAGTRIRDVVAPAEESTLRRWKKEFSELLSKFCTVMCTAVNFIKKLGLQPPVVCENRMTLLKKYFNIFDGAEYSGNILRRCFWFSASHHLRVGCPQAG